ncbi:MAG: VOC family protein [Caulobacterales bacterium]|nr:VOC family protein [Caulobacterales bacterium]
MTETIKRTTLIVRDAEAGARWYEHVFGMTRWFDKPFTLSGVGLAAGEAGDETRLVILKANHPEIGMIGLLEWVNPRMDAPAEIPTRVGFGAPIFVVASDDAHGVHARAVEMGTRIHSAPHEWTVVGAKNETKHMVGVSLFDRDGYFYEVNQTLRVEPAA